ncbi:MbnP family protein [Pontibacter rugosus]|uniref:MbnP family protein n=1 Tax=Pontibacter rugosus TaxID=1745966 RepID=A0ABW3SQG0_9BACT
MKYKYRSLMAKLVLFAAMAPLFSACSDEEDAVAEADVAVQFQNLVDGQPIELNKTYTSPAGDTYQVEDYKYYISNIKLLDASGNVVYTEPESYHLINQTEEKTAFTLAKVPAGKYSKIEFSLGVDAAHNHSTDQPGDLDPSNDMVWNWDTGYKFLLLEGTYTGNTKSGGLIFHIGHDANYKTFTLPLQQPLDIRTSPAYTLQISSELNALFQSPHLIDFDELNTAMGGEAALKIVENYTTDFFQQAIAK